MAVEGLLLDALDVAEGVVVEDHPNQRDVVQLHRRQLLHVVHEAAVAVDRDDLLVRVADLHPQRGGEAVAERPLVAGADEGALLVDREADRREVADLRALVDQDAVLRQLAADRLGVGRLRLDLVELVGDLLLQPGQLLLARGPPAARAVDVLDQPRQP